jgi:Tol biopolymer transport system component
VDRWIGAGLVIALVAVIAILGLPALRHLSEAPPPVQLPLRFSLAAPAGAELGAGDDILDAAISPDERHIVFVATTDGTTRLWLRELRGDQAVPLLGTIGARLPAWKQTGNVVSFFTDGRLKEITIATGRSARELANASAGSGASWLLDGSLLFAPDARGVIRRLLNGAVSDATTLRPGDRSHTFPTTVGSSNAFVYVATVDDGRRTLRLVENGQERDLGTTSGHGQIVGDALLHVRDGVLLSQRLDPETRQPSGNATPVVLDVGVGTSGHGFFAASARLLIAAPAAKRLRQLTWYALGSREGTATREPGDYWQVRLSPDDRYAAVTQLTPLLRTLDVVLMPMSETGNVEPVTRALAADSDPVWSPDALALVFRSLQDGRPHLYTRPAHDQDADDQIVRMSEIDETPTDWRGDRVLAHAPGTAGDFDLWTIVPSTGAREKAAGSRFNETDGRLSPDGRWIAYVSDESGQADIYATPWPRGARVRVSFAGGTRPRWGRDARSLFFMRGTRIMRADLSGSSTFTTAREVLEVPGVRDFDVAHRRDALIVLSPAPASSTPVPAVVVDWMHSGTEPVIQERGPAAR